MESNEANPVNVADSSYNNNSICSSAWFMNMSIQVSGGLGGTGGGGATSTQ